VASPKHSLAKTGRYSRVSRRIWNDERFRRLTPIPPCGQGLFLRLLTAPELNNIPGLFQAWEAGLAQSLGWTLEAFREAFAEAFREGLAKASWKDGLVWLPKSIWHNEPESPNVVLSWSTAWAELPDCPLKNEAFVGLNEWAKAKGKPWAEAFGKAFGKASPKACPNQDQDQDQREEIPPTPQPAEPEPRPQRTPRRDPLAEQLEGKLPGQRRDVQTLFAEWRKVFGSPNAKIVHANGVTAQDLATAIDAHGLEMCIKVCREAVNDGMVSGRDDERHVKHTSASYIFGNENTFNRILKSVEEKSTRESAADMIERMKKAPAASC
jgi:hypothetical protein